MKARYIIAVLIPILSIVSCTKNEENGNGNGNGTDDKKAIEITATGLITAFDFNGGELKVPFDAQGDWTAAAEDTKSSSFVTVFPESGKAGHNTVTITVAKNTTAENRSASVNLISGKDTETLVISQTGGRVLNIEFNEKTVPAEDNTFTMSLEANCAWSISRTEEYSDWMAISPTSGAAGKSVLSFSFLSNPDLSERKATVRFSDDPLVELFITQEGREPTINVSYNSNDFNNISYFRTELQAEVHSEGGSWIASSDEDYDWVRLSKTSGDGEYSVVTVEIDINFTGEDRTAEFKFGLVNYPDAQSASIKIYQKGVNAPIHVRPINLPAGKTVMLNAMSISENDYNGIAALEQRELVSAGDYVAIICSPDLIWKGNYMKFDAYSPVDNNYLSIKDGRVSSNEFILNYTIPDLPEDDFPIYISDLYNLEPNILGNNQDIQLSFKQALSRLSLVTDDSALSGAGATLSVKSVKYILGFSSATITVNHTSGFSTVLDADSKTVVPNYTKVDDSGYIVIGDAEEQYMYSRYLPACSSNLVKIEVNYVIQTSYSVEEFVVSFIVPEGISSFEAGHEYRIIFKPTFSSYSIQVIIQDGGGGGTK